MKSRWMALAGSLAFLAGCGGGQGSSNNNGTSTDASATGKLTVLLRDAPASLQAAVVTITEVDLVGASGSLVLSTAKTTTDLLKLSNDTATLVGGAVVPAGTYTQLRFVITGGYIQTAEGAIYASSPTYEGLPADAVVTGKLRMPSFAHSGLKIDLPDGGLTIAGPEKIVLVDFDVSQSFGHEAGNSGAWVMHPVCKATDVAVTGSLHVTLALAPQVVLPAGVTLAYFGVAITPVAGGDTLAAALADEGGGEFGVVFSFLAPGDYSISFVPPATVAAFTTDPITPATATVSSDGETSAPFLLTAASPPAAPPAAPAK
jgi:hypothetical protein